MRRVFNDFIVVPSMCYYLHTLRGICILQRRFWEVFFPAFASFLVRLAAVIA
jgi:hypothetical protein